MTPSTVETRTSGKEPREFLVAYDALAVYVHKNNPLEEITLEQLGQIYGEDGKVTKWSQLGVKIPGGVDENIIYPPQRGSVCIRISAVLSAVPVEADFLDDPVFDHKIPRRRHIVLRIND
jgi:hypothetical protein